MLWSIKDSPFYILGSIDVFDETPPPISAETELAYENAQRVVFETNFEKTPDISHGYYPAGETLRESIPPPLYDAVKALWHELGKDEAELERLRPWLVGAKLYPRLLERSGFENSSGVDRYFFSRAKADRRNVRFFETSTSLMQTIAKAPAVEQARVLAWTLDREAFESDARRMILAWRERRAETIDLLRGDAPLAAQAHGVAHDEVDLGAVAR